MSDEEALYLPDELYDERLELKTFQLERGVEVCLNCAPEHLQMSDRSAFLVVWPASIATANCLIKRIDSTTDEDLRVLELGCGMGLCGLALSRLEQVGCVVLSDADDRVLENLGRHIDSQKPDKVHLERLFWGNEEDIQRVRGQYSTEGFDLIIGTDVTYCAKYISSLIYTASVLLKPQSASLFLCYSMPRFAQFEAQVFELASGEGLSFIKEHETEEPNTKLVEFKKLRG